MIIRHQGDLGAKGLTVSQQQHQIETAIQEPTARWPDKDDSPSLTPPHLIPNGDGVIMRFKLNDLSFHLKSRLQLK
jgi:hypothetical protein